MKHYLILALILLLLVGCGGEPAPTPDAVATQVAQAQAVAATLTAAVPAPTETPTASPAPTMTDTPVPTVTPIPSETPIPLVQGSPLDYLPTESEMPDGFSVAANRSPVMGDEDLPGMAVVYHRGYGLILEVVGFTVFVTPDEDTAQLFWTSMEEDMRDKPQAEVNVIGADEHLSVMEEGPSVQTFIRYKNVFGAVFSGGGAVADSEYYVALLMQKLRE